MKFYIRQLIFINLFLFLTFSSGFSTELPEGLIFPEYSKVVSMDFKDASLKDLLKIFSQQSGLNFIASESVKNRTVTLYLDKVPVEDALEKILTANNLTYDIKQDSNIFVVRETGKPAIETITKIYFLKYASVSKSKISREILASIIPGGISSRTTGGTGAYSTSGLSSATSLTQTTTDTTSIGGSGYGAISLGILEAVTKALSENGHATEDPRTNSIVVTDVPTQFPIIEQVIARLDIPIPQIMIEVEMLDVTKNTADKLGVKFSGTFANFSGPKYTTYFPFSETKAVASGASVPTYTVGTLDLSGLTAALQFLSTQTDTKFLARPRLLTISNETAEIKITTQEAIGLKTTTQASEGASTQTSEAERAETGVSLRVTPQVNPETGEITMFIEPKVSQARAGGQFGGTTFKDPEERLTRSVLRIKDGETIVIGGLLRTDYTQVITKVPILGDIPLLGAAFRHREKTKDEERELIVFITPKIVKETKQMSLKTTYSKDLEREQEMPVLAAKEVEKALDEIEKKRRP